MKCVGQWKNAPDQQYLCQRMSAEKMVEEVDLAQLTCARRTEIWHGEMCEMYEVVGFDAL